jgi:large subunit ribosomal protein L7e
LFSLFFFDFFNFHPKGEHFIDNIYSANKVPPVPESILRKRKIADQKKADELKNRTELRKKVKASRRVMFKRAESYIKEYRNQEKSLLRFKRAARSVGNYYVEPEPKLALVVRIRGINQIHPRPRKVLQLLRLKQINNAVFVKINKATLNMLKLVDPYVAWGYPNLKTVKELIYKRGFAKVNGNRLPILDNSIIEKHLGKQGLICMEDLVHEIYTVGGKFTKVNRFFWPFKLNPPRGGYTSVTKHYSSGGDFGNREDQISELVQRMN